MQAGSVLQSPGIAPRIVLASPYGRRALVVTGCIVNKV